MDERYVSTGRNYPFYGVQWHPEVNRFQWDPCYNFPHSSNAVRISSLLAEFFVNEGNYSLSLVHLFVCDVPGLYTFGWTDAVLNEQMHLCVFRKEKHTPLQWSSGREQRAHIQLQPCSCGKHLCLWTDLFLLIILSGAEKENPSLDTSDWQMYCNIHRPHI